MKCFHEAPKCIFNKIQARTDGDYALVHLFEQDIEYFQLFKEAVAKGREVILDNSVFELGSAFDVDRYAFWIEQLEPTYYIVPDVLENSYATIARFFDFLEKYPYLPGKIIGVAQGASKEDFITCYKAIAPFCDMIAISFDYSWLTSVDAGKDKWHQLAMGRQDLLFEMLSRGIIDTDKPHHLLGVALPQEVYLYGQLQALGALKWLYSVDTSNPVIHGIRGQHYGAYGLETKDTTKLCTLVEASVPELAESVIMYNVEKFRRWANGLG